ncbi:MAG TPA: LytTR family DNA-binding domain-containing protein, partial [Bauldia sp.]|nr:LytTR family DNA-binding domain-containing protein [Bauldia sp.]
VIASARSGRFTSMVATTAPALSVDLLAIVVAVVAFVVSGLFLLILVPEREEEAARGPARRGVPDDAITVLAAEGPAAPPDAGFPTAAAEAAAGDGAADASAASRQLPVEQDGATRYIPVASIVAVHANAHYTTIFDGKHKYFCPLAIGDVEARLDPARFARVHRSHIVAVDRVVKLRKAGDSGRAELAGGEAVP